MSHNTTRGQADPDTPFQIVTKTEPTFYFVGVTTHQSSIMKVFPRWMKVMGRPEVVIEGINHAIHDNPVSYRSTVAQIKYDPLSLGALVTTHKIDLLSASRDMFDKLHVSAEQTEEISSISKRGEQLWGHAKDPLTSGLSLDAILGQGYFGSTGGHVLCFGAGGSGKAISLHFINKMRPDDRPTKMIVNNRSHTRLDALKQMVGGLDTDITFEYNQNADPTVNDNIMAKLPEGSIVINATGMGKDTPGSPITNAGLFPRKGVAWEINYRGDLDFWHQAMAQRQNRDVVVEDGWLYFLHGWTQVISEVLHLDIDAPTFQRLSEVAEQLRPPLQHIPD